MKARIFVFIAIALFLMGCATIPPPNMDQEQTTEIGYSYQGPIDPIEFQSWIEVYSEPIMTPFGVIFDLYLRNPDPEAQIQFVNVRVGSQGIYRYYLLYDGNFFCYHMNSDTSCYEKKDISAELLEILKSDFKTAFGIVAN